MILNFNSKSSNCNLQFNFLALEDLAKCIICILCPHDLPITIAQLYRQQIRINNCTGKNMSISSRPFFIIKDNFLFFELHNSDFLTRFSNCNAVESEATPQNIHIFFFFYSIPHCFISLSQSFLYFIFFSYLY